ncbi:sugar ABC transporter permease [Kordiimonas sediminis]|uniref:Sugar ABC transporter permease n=1 Tax=Kordiimonas sediminis TaxID=1735581 RepID=A0A919AT92_9PROT|nr:FtsX-like permease family protein [Kordiimonas sediminis]GHF24193.1 sugar ABC transporter permease [Kordiimonas sediminis]
MNMPVLVLEHFAANIRHKNTMLVLWTQGLLSVILLTLTMTISSIQLYLEDNLKSLLGADVVVEHTRALPDNDVAFLAENSDKISETLILPVSLTFGDKWERVALKVVDGAYPVQGAVQVSDAVGQKPYGMRQGPGPSEIWIGGRVASRLQVQVGSLVRFAGHDFRISAILHHEPDRLMEGHTVEMRAMVSKTSFPFDAFPSDSKQYRYLLAADINQRSEIHAWQGSEGQEFSVLDRHKGQHPLASYWTRVENFLGLTFVILFFMASIAISLAGKSKLAASRYAVAVMMSMGLTGRQGYMLAFCEWLLGFLIAIVPATILAAFLQLLISKELSATFVGINTQMDPAAILGTIALLFCMFLIMQIPILLQISRTTVLSLIREVQDTKTILITALWNGLALAVLAWIYTDNWTLTTMVIVSLMSALAFLLFLTWSLFTTGNLVGRRRPGLLSFVLFMMKERLLVKSTQIIGLGMSLMLLLVGVGLMQDLRGTMNSQVRTQNGNLIISEAPDAAVPGIQQWADDTGSNILSLYPFLNASVVRLNGARLNDFATQPSEALARLKRPIRLSWSADVPDNNRLVRGDWWQPQDMNWRQISVEEEVMSDMGLSLGDTITFDIDGSFEDFTIVASHAFKTGGTSITFWFQVPEQSRQHLKAKTHHMGGVEVSETGWNRLGSLLQEYPSLHVVTLREVTGRLDATFALVSKATSGFSIIIMTLSLIVVLASVSGFEAKDRKRNGLLLSMGLTREDCLKVTAYEWLLTALVSAGGAVFGTWIMGTLIYSDQLSMTYDPDLRLYSVVIIAFSVCLLVTGLWISRRSMEISVREQLREN